MRVTFEPALALDRGEQALLTQMYYQPGYKILHRVFRAEVDKFFLALVNTPADDIEAVVAAHKLAKAAAMFYEGITNRVNEEVLQFSAAPKASDAPIDITSVLDIGDSYEQAAALYQEEYE